MKEVELKYSGIKILVDIEDYERVNMYEWYARGRKMNTIVSVVPPYRPLANFVMRSCDVMFDHKNSNPYDFRKENLRQATYRQNAQNNSKQQRLNPCSSKHKGVMWNKANQNWRAKITDCGKCINIGSFSTEVEAAIAYNKKAAELFGEFAKLNNVG